MQQQSSQAQTRLNVVKTSKRGIQIIQDPLLNKGTAFTQEERDELQLNGLLPNHISSVEEQQSRAFEAVMSKTEPLDRYVALLALQDRNEHLYYSLLNANMEAFLPIVYTPTVGLACQKFSHVFQRARGLWITPDMRGNIKDVLANAVAERHIQLIVATDNESILGIGDQGAGGMAISVGKLALYVAGAGIHPGETLPISLDVGTNNKDLLDDDLYLGYRHPRLEGEEYSSFVAEFVAAVQAVCPHALLQWEDFRKDNALAILDTYRSNILSFNDDIQGTGAIALAGLFGAMRILKSKLSQHRILIMGAGAAGMGIANQIKAALKEEGLDETESRHRLAMLDSKGLLVRDQPIADAYKIDLAWDAEVAQQHNLSDPSKRDLKSVVEAFKPTILIGTSGQAGVFDETLTRAVCAYEERPIILPFSNPTSHSEAVPEDLIRWSNGKVLVATGSPFAPVTYEDQTFEIGQGNNVFIFPGLGLGALVAKATEVTDAMVTAAAHACADAVTQSELDKGMLYPNVARLREVSKEVAKSVALQAIQDGQANLHVDQVDAELTNMMWAAEYPELQAE